MSHLIVKAAWGAYHVTVLFPSDPCTQMLTPYLGLSEYKHHGMVSAVVMTPVTIYLHCNGIVEQILSVMLSPVSWVK